MIAVQEQLLGHCTTIIRKSVHWGNISIKTVQGTSLWKVQYKINLETFTSKISGSNHLASIFLLVLILI